MGNADHRIGAMRVDHICDAVGDQVAARQRIKHTVVTHRDTVVDRDGVEFLGDSARRFDLARDHLAQVLQMDVAGDELGEAVDHRDDRSEEHTSELQSLMRISYAVFCSKKKKVKTTSSNYVSDNN